MTTRDIRPEDRSLYNSVVSHPLQSYEWGEFREQQGIKVIRKGLFDKDKLVSAFQLTIHKIPHSIFTIGYLPKGTLPNTELLEQLKKIGQENNCIYIQLEPNIHKSDNFDLKIKNLKKSFHPLFTKYSFILDLTKSEEELLKNMHHKTRYNIRVAQKHEVMIVEDNSDEAFETYWKIMEETTSRQKFYAHTKSYHKKQWEIFAKKKKFDPNELQYHLMLANYNPPSTNQIVTLAAWVLFTFHDTLYYPYGSSSSENRETMASNLMMWEAIRFGKKLGLKYFDMWGSLGPKPDIKDPWFGFHRFKQGYNPLLTEFMGSYDLVINQLLYQVLKVVDKLRWIYLRMKK